MPIILFFFLALIPAIEIAVILKVGSLVGFAPTMGTVVLTSLLGVYMLKKEGVAVWQRVRSTLAAKQIPMTEMLESILLAVGSLLLLTPGFVSDSIGLVFVLPFSRRFLAKGFLAKTMNSAVFWSVEAFNEFQGDRQAAAEDTANTVYEAKAGVPSEEACSHVDKKPQIIELPYVIDNHNENVEPLDDESPCDKGSSENDRGAKTTAVVEGKADNEPASSSSSQSLEHQVEKAVAKEVIKPDEPSVR